MCRFAAQRCHALRGNLCCFATQRRYTPVSFGIDLIVIGRCAAFGRIINLTTKRRSIQVLRRRFAARSECLKYYSILVQILI